MENHQKNYPSFLQNAKYYFLEFCDRSGIHGFNYIGERKRPILEKFWWLIIMVASIYFSVFMVYQTFTKWQNSPVIVTFATQHTAIWEIPFPAVTICPEIKSSKSRYNYTDYYLKKEALMNLTDDENAKFEYMSLLCDADQALLNKSFSTIDNAALDFLYEVTPNFTESLYLSSWRGEKYYDDRVSEIFTPIITSQGICYTFNIIDRSEFYTDIVGHFKDIFSANGKRSSWSSENGYTAESDIDSYPRRTIIAGTKGGLNLVFQVSRDDSDYACGEAFQGFRIIIHPPDQIPRVKQKYFRLPPDHSVVVAIKPNMMTTSKDLQPYEPSIRRCYFIEERKLKYFGVYNQENCMLECLGNFTMKFCGCVSMHSPKQNSTPICGQAIKPCLEKAKSTFTRHQENPKTKCDCLPSCNALDYNAEISQSRWDWRPFMEIERSTKLKKAEVDQLLSKEAHFSQLVLYYKDMQFITSERNELYTSMDFWSNCGGLLGLFTGFTFLSAFEIFYFLTIRLFFNIRMFGRRYWSGSEELLRRRKNE